MKVRDIIRVPGFGWAGPLAGPLGRRLLAGLLLLSLVPLALSNGLGYLRSAGIIEGLVERYLHGIADLQSLHVRDQLEWHTLFLRELASHDPISAIPGEAAVRLSSHGDNVRIEQDVNLFLEQRMGEVPAFEALYVYTSDGTIVASAPLPPVDLGFWLGPPLHEPRGVFEIVREATPPRSPRLRLAVPLEVGGDTIPGWYVGGSIQVLGPSDFVQLPQHTAGAVETFIVGADGVPIFVSHPHETIDFSIRLATPLFDRALRSSMVYPDRLGVEVIGTMVAVPDYPWRLITEVPVSDALQELRELRAVSLWLGWFLALSVVALALLLAGRIVVPVRRLVSATRRLAAGDLGARVQVREKNEIGELGAAFNEMASELARTSMRVKELHEREIERAGQLATVGELASGVAHEIKNPIQGISGGLDLVMRHTQDHARLRSVVDEMSRQVSRVDVAVKDLLAFARPATPHFAPVDINKTLERAFTLVRPTADRARVHLEVDAGDVPPLFIDEEMISQSLVNLVMNGVQATEDDGCVTVRTRSVENGVEIQISDTGKGIPSEQMDHIFKPFFTTKHQGTGLGLSISRTIIERHNGTLSVESTDGEGTTFTVTLPRSGDGNAEPR